MAAAAGVGALKGYFANNKAKKAIAADTLELNKALKAQKRGANRGFAHALDYMKQSAISSSGSGDMIEFEIKKLADAVEYRKSVLENTKKFAKNAGKKAATIWGGVTFLAFAVTNVLFGILKSPKE